jgi:hypothetical protein
LARDRGDGQAHRSGREHFSIAGSHEDAGFMLFQFTTRSKAPAMQYRIAAASLSGPMPSPFLGPQLGVGANAP